MQEIATKHPLPKGSSLSLKCWLMLLLVQMKAYSDVWQAQKE